MLELALPWPLAAALAALVAVGVTSLAGRVARRFGPDRPPSNRRGVPRSGDAPFRPGHVAALHDVAARLARDQRRDAS